MVEYQCGGQAQTRGPRETVAQFDTAERVQSQVGERGRRIDRSRMRIGDQRDLLAHQLLDHVGAVLAVETGQPRAQHRALYGIRSRGVVKQRMPVPRAQYGILDPYRDRHGRTRTRRGVRHSQCGPAIQGCDTQTSPPRRVGIGEPIRHTAGHLPRPPGERDRWVSGGAAAPGDGIECGVGRGIPGLPGRAENSCQRGEQDECRQVEVARELVQY